VVSCQVEEDLDRATCLITDGDVASLLPSKTHGAFLKMFLGPVNLRATRKEVQLKVKEEYNSYRVCVKVYYSWYYRCQVVFFEMRTYTRVPETPINVEFWDLVSSLS